MRAKAAPTNNAKGREGRGNGLTTTAPGVAVSAKATVRGDDEGRLAQELELELELELGERGGACSVAAVDKAARSSQAPAPTRERAMASGDP